MFTWAIRNWADTSASDAKLAPLILPTPRQQARECVCTAIAKLPRWQVVSADDHVIRATRQTRLFRFIDDITIRLEDAGNGSTRVHVRSQSRVGKGDLGQNRRNILELFSSITASGRVDL